MLFKGAARVANNRSEVYTEAQHKATQDACRPILLTACLFTCKGIQAFSSTACLLRCVSSEEELCEQEQFTERHLCLRALVCLSLTWKTGVSGPRVTVAGSLSTPPISLRSFSEAPIKESQWKQPQIYKTPCM